MKIDGQDLDDPSDPANDPKLDCEVPVQFQGFSQGDTFTTTISFEGQGSEPDPVVSGGNLNPEFVGKGSGSSIADHVETFYLAGSDHVKVSVEVSSGSRKFKVFKVEPCPAPTFTVVKTNNANGVLPFSASEVATAAGADVAFKATITNGSPYAIAVSSVTDSVGGGDPVSVDCDPDLATIPAGDSRDCLFTLTGYAPATGSKVNTVSVTANQLGDASIERTVQSGNSTVLAPSGGGAIAPAFTVTKLNNANGDASFNASEQAAAASAAVPFKVTIANGSAYEITVSSVTDAIDGAAGVSVACVPALPAIPAGESRDCLFTLQNYAPSTGSKVNTVTVTAYETGNSTNSTGVTSLQSTVLAPSSSTCADRGDCPSKTCAELDTCPAPPTCQELGTCPAPPTCQELGTCPAPPTDTPIGGVTDPDPATAEMPAEEPTDNGTTPPATPPADDTDEQPRALPFTGSSSDLLLGLGAGLSVMGLLLALAGRRRRLVE